LEEILPAPAVQGKSIKGAMGNENRKFKDKFLFDESDNILEYNLHEI
jgi:hypothetical protein